jgi:hypothetical protein
MNKWTGIKIAIGCMLVHGSYAQERPNILLITADDMNWKYLQKSQ